MKGTNKSRIKVTSVFLLAVIAIVSVTVTVFAVGGGGLWRSAGQNLHNTRYQQNEHKISPANVADLQVKWSFSTDDGNAQTLDDISATPAVDGSAAYFPSWNGNLYKVDRRSGEMIWARAIEDFTGERPMNPSLGDIAPSFSRTTPAIDGDLLIFGDQGGRRGFGASMMAVDKNSGDLIWISKIDDFPFAMVTQSAVVHAGTVYVGVSSFEELFAEALPGYVCCEFQGKVVALDAATGVVKWETSMAPDADFSGNAVWGSTPVVDTKRGSLYVTTGNNYTVSAAMLACMDGGAEDETCNPPGNYFDSIVALDLKTGEVKWSKQALLFDSWNVACFPDLLPGGPNNPGNCDDPSGPDHDFGQGPALFTTKDGNGKKIELLGAGQKSGQYWALNPDTGEVVWVTQVGPGGLTGGLQWGSAVDGERVYTAIANFNSVQYTLVNPSLGSLPDTNQGLWSALDTRTGEILWQTADPNYGQDQGAVTTANGVMFGCSMEGTMYALDAVTGVILWSFDSEGSCNAGAAVVDGTVYWGSGYGSFGGVPNNQLFAFEVPK
jgi:polyvinyl alcohol dehydrogenase (cytochrome)